MERGRWRSGNDHSGERHGRDPDRRSGIGHPAGDAPPIGTLLVHGRQQRGHRRQQHRPTARHAYVPFLFLFLTFFFSFDFYFLPQKNTIAVLCSSLLKKVILFSSFLFHVPMQRIFPTFSFNWILSI